MQIDNLAIESDILMGGVRLYAGDVFGLAVGHEAVAGGAPPQLTLMITQLLLYHLFNLRIALSR